MQISAFLLIILAAFLHALWNFSAKKASGNLSAIWLGLMIASIALIPFLLFLNPGRIFEFKALPYIIATGIIHAVYFFTLAKAYEHGDISIVYPIARGSGIAGTAIIAHILLNEEISIIGCIGIILISTGTLLLGYKNNHQKRGIFFAVITAAMIICYSIVDKNGVGVIHPLGYIFYLSFLTTILLAPYMLIKRRHELSSALKNMKKYSMIIGFGSIGTYLIILFVYQIAQVSYVVAARELAVGIGALFGFIFLREECTAKKVFAISGIVIGLILIKLA